MLGLWRWMQFRANYSNATILVLTKYPPIRRISHEIIHRDLKYENIMFSTPDSSAVKIIDFGLGKKYAHEEHLHDAVGTVYTMAPEVST